MRHVAIALALASASCSSCRGETTASRPAVAEAASASPSPSGLPSASPSATTASSASGTAAAADAEPPPPPSGLAWEVVARRKASEPPLFVVELGTHVLVGDRSPLAWAEGAGPLVAAPPIATTPERHVIGVAGTFPAVFVATDKRVHRLLGSGWQDAGPVTPKTKALVTFGARGAMLVASMIERNALPTILPEDQPATTLRPFVEKGAAVPVLSLEPGFGAFDAAGTRDGHLFLLGFRAGRKGLWLAHLEEGTKTGYQLYPGSDRCDDAGFGIYVYRSRVIAMTGGRAYLFIVNDAAECMGPIGTYLYERSEKGFGGASLPKSGIDAMGIEIIGSARDGTLFMTTLDGEAYRRSADGKTTVLDVPKGCNATAVAVKDDGDAWMIARCEKETEDRVYRRGRPQSPLAL